MDVINQDFCRLINTDLSKCIRRLEDALGSIKMTPFHKVLGLDFLHHVNDAAEYMISFHQKAVKDFKKLSKIDPEKYSKVKAFYFEMNGFAYNTGLWFFDGFAYGTLGNEIELDWLAHWQADTGDWREDSFILTGMEAMQRVYAVSEKDHSHSVTLSSDICETLTDHLVVARFMQLIKAAHAKAKKKYPPLSKVHLFATAHDWDDVLHST